MICQRCNSIITDSNEVMLTSSTWVKISTLKFNSIVDGTQVSPVRVICSHCIEELLGRKLVFEDLGVITQRNHPNFQELLPAAALWWIINRCDEPPKARIVHIQECIRSLSRICLDPNGYRQLLYEKIKSIGYKDEFSAQYLEKRKLYQRMVECRSRDSKQKYVEATSQYLNLFVGKYLQEVYDLRDTFIFHLSNYQFVDEGNDKPSVLLSGEGIKVENHLKCSIEIVQICTPRPYFLVELSEGDYKDRYKRIKSLMSNGRY